MADILIDITLRVGGVATAADSLPVLRDADNTYGIKRLDSGVVVVAAGTALVAGDGIGHYTYTLHDAAAGVQYAYVIEATVSGSLIRVPGTRSITALNALPSYLGIDDANQLAASMFGLAGWAAVSTEDKVRALAAATARVDVSYRWQGRKVAYDQVLEFPRFEARYGLAWWCECYPNLPAPTVPLNIQRAVLFEADSILAGARKRLVAAQHDGLQMQQIGSAIEQYRPPTNAAGVPVLCADADQLVRPFILRSGALR